MRKEFENVSRKLVLISDCHGTLVSLSMNPLFREYKLDRLDRKDTVANKLLMSTLIEAKQAGHIVILVSKESGLGTVTELILPTFKQPKEFFDIHVADKIYDVAPKQKLPEILAAMGIDKVDYIFDDENPRGYLPDIEIVQHVEPLKFFREDQFSEVSAIRAAIASPQP